MFVEDTHPGEKKTPNGDKVDNNIVIPSFYKNIIFTSLSRILYKAIIIIIRGMNGCVLGTQHWQTSTKASIKQRKIRLCF